MTWGWLNPRMWNHRYGGGWLNPCIIQESTVFICKQVTENLDLLFLTWKMKISNLEKINIIAITVYGLYSILNQW